MHSNDFDDSEEVLCDDVAEGCTFPFHEDELEDDCDELHSSPMMGFLTSSTMRKLTWMITFPVMKVTCLMPKTLM